MYSAYVKEREGLETLECPSGFALFSTKGDECYLKDIYVIPELRRGGIAASMADKVAEIARERGCKWLVGSISPPANGAQDSLLALLAYGMRLHKAEKDIIYMVKGI